MSAPGEEREKSTAQADPFTGTSQLLHLELSSQSDKPG